MPQPLAYYLAVIPYVAATTLTLLSLRLPWLTLHLPAPGAAPLTINHGLFRSHCSLTHRSRHYPDSDLDCLGDAARFCTLYRTAGFAVAIALVFLACAGIALGIVLWNAQGFTARGVRYTRQGWKAVVPLVVVPAGAQGLAIAIVACVKGYSEVFSVPGWEFGEGWWSAVGAAVVSAWIGIGMGWAAWRERVEGYQLLPGEAED